MSEAAMGGRRRRGRREEGACGLWVMEGGALMAPADPGHCLLPMGLRAEQMFCLLLSLPHAGGWGHQAGEGDTPQAKRLGRIRPMVLAAGRHWPFPPSLLFILWCKS